MQLPAEYEFGTLDWLSSQMMEGFITGLHRSPYHGFSVEFSEHKIYNPGESTRHVDWKLFAKTDRLYTKRYEEETNMRCRLVIDTSGSMFYPEKKNISPAQPNKLQFSLFCSAALTHLFRRQRDAFGLSLFDEDIQVETESGTTSAHHHYILGKMEEWLEKSTSPQTKTRVPAVMHRLADTLPRRSLIIIFSDFFTADQAEQEELFSALQHLKYNKHEVILFQTLDVQTEIDFNLEDHPLKMLDLEGTGSLKIHPEELRSLYIEQIQAFQHEFHVRCRQYGITRIEADIRDGYRQVLQGYLLQRKRFGMGS